MYCLDSISGSCLPIVSSFLRCQNGHPLWLPSSPSTSTASGTSSPVTPGPFSSSSFGKFSSSITGSANSTVCFSCLSTRSCPPVTFASRGVSREECLVASPEMMAVTMTKATRSKVRVVTSWARRLSCPETPSWQSWNFWKTAVLGSLVVHVFSKELPVKNTKPESLSPFINFSCFHIVCHRNA